MRLITVAIHTYDRALSVKALLESEGIEVTLQNVNLEQPEVSSGVRVRIKESDLPLALRIVENPEIFSGINPTPADNAPMAHNVVVPTDFSEHSYNATRAAFRIAAAHHADVTLLHAYIDPRISANVQLTDSLNYEIAGADALQQLVISASGMMTKVAARLRAEMKEGTLPVVRFTHKIVEGVPEDAIIDFAKATPPFLVVMGTRSATDKERDMIGSVTAEVLDESRFSVLAIPDRTDTDFGQQPLNILFFSNLDQEDILAMDTLYRYFPKAESRVTIVHIPSRHRLTDKTSGRAAMALSDYCSKKFTHYTFENVPLTPKSAVEELEQLQSERKFDLIVVPNRRRNALTRMFNPGIANRLLFHADIPMLVIPV